MKNTVTLWRKATPIWQLLALTFLISLCASSGVAQTATPTPPDKRGLGIESSSTATSQNDQIKAKEAKPELVLQTGYNNFFGAGRLVFSPDGRLLATGTFRSGAIKLWETATGRELRNISTGAQTAMSMSPVFTFSPDGRLLAVGASNNSVKVYDVISGREVQTLAGGQASFMASFGATFIAFSADGKKLVTVSDAIKVWDVASWRELKTLDTTSLTTPGLAGGEGGMALSPDGNQLARAESGGKNEIKFLDLTTGREARSVSLPHDQIDSLELCFALDGHLVAAGIVEKKLKVWDITTKQTERDLAPTAQDFSLIKFSRDGRLVALSEGYAIKIWDLTTGRVLPTLNVPNLGVFTQYGGVSVSFSVDGKKAATGGFGTHTLLWDTETGKQILPMTGRSNMAYAVAFSADGTQLSAGGRTRWDLRTGRGLRVTPAPSDKLFGIPGPDGKLIAMFAPNNNSITILETTTGRQLQTLNRSATGGGVERVTFSPDGHLLAARYMEDPASQGQKTIGSPSSQVKIWDVTTGREVQTLILAGWLRLAGRVKSCSGISHRVTASAALRQRRPQTQTRWEISVHSRISNLARCRLCQTCRTWLTCQR
jgi:WD40 repeat protein